MWRVLTLCGLLWATPVLAQDDRAQTLADIRQELTILNVEVQKLKRELSTTGAAGGLTVGGSVLDRVDAIEAQLVRLTGRAEQMQNTVDRVIADGTNRIGDLEFRLVELEGGDTSKLGQTSTLGGGAAPVVAVPQGLPQGTAQGLPQAGATPPGGPELAIGERDDFGRASEALAKGDFRAAADQFATFGTAYPGSPLSAEAFLKQGEALEGLGERTPAARAFLAAFSAETAGPFAPDALYRLGNMLGQLGQTQEACVTMTEVGVRFPTAPVVAQAEQARARIGCN